MKIAFIGAGKMAEALLSRLDPSLVMASDVNANRLKFLKKKYRVAVTEDNIKAFCFGEVVILAVKPQQMAQVLNEAASRVASSPKLVISIAAGMPLDYLQKKLPGFPIIRAMPNNPCLVGTGITALAKGKKAGAADLKKAKAIFGAVGEVLEVPEKWMDAVTGLSGSGPAFVYQVIDGLIQGGKDSGLPNKIAEKLALQTILGAAETVKRSGLSAKELCKMVASPGGTTIEGLAVLEKHKTVEAFKSAVSAAARKAKRLSRDWTK